jgi:hypothetical protein
MTFFSQIALEILYLTKPRANVIAFKIRTVFLIYYLKNLENPGEVDEVNEEFYKPIL